jgi:hypothetical protein
MTARAISVALVFSQIACASSAGSEVRTKIGIGYVESAGTIWYPKPNRHGAVLLSRSQRLYLGRQCDAYSSQLGRGRWGGANGGLLVIFAGRTFAFARVDPPVKNARCAL